MDSHCYSHEELIVYVNNNNNKDWECSQCEDIENETICSNEKK